MIRNVDILALPCAIDAASLKRRAAVVVDVLRACTTIVSALANGAQKIVPAQDPAEALALADASGRSAVFVGGERGSLPVPGFDAGNSPALYGRNEVNGKTVVFTTTNGTSALRAAAKAGASPLFCGAFVNAGAVAAALDRSGTARAAIVCAGQDGEFSFEDFACAGAIVTKLAGYANGSLDCADAALAAARLYAASADGLSALLERGRHARTLIALGLGSDIEFCARVDALPVVPEYRNGAIVLV